MRPVFIQSAGLGSVDSSPTEVRVFSGVSLAISAAMGYGAFTLYKRNHPVWGTLVALLAVGGLANNAVGLVTGKQWLGA